jgi:uncharacterized protein (TIGR00255 family)
MEDDIDRRESMQSMTGFGHVEKHYDSFDIVLEIKTVNSRFFDFKGRLSREVTALEAAVKTRIQNRIKRGRVELFLDLRQKAQNLFELNETLVSNYLSLAKDLENKGVKGSLEISDVLNIPGVIVQKERAGFTEGEIESILSAVDETVDLVFESRADEGKNIKNTLEEHLKRLEQLLNEISLHSQEVEQFHRKRLQLKIEEHLNRELVDEQRLAQEVLYYVDRTDISEERARLTSHIERFRTYLLEGESSPVGKKLDFLCQELVRETNTIMSKAGIIQITEIGVECKAEIERIREQVQNLE